MARRVGCDTVEGGVRALSAYLDTRRDRALLKDMAGSGMSWVDLVAHYVAHYEEQKYWMSQLKEQSVKQIRSKPPYWTMYINTHDVDDSTKRLVHLPGTFIPTQATVNPIGRELDLAERKNKVTSFPTFEEAGCEICWRMDFRWHRRFTPASLRRHIRMNHRKTPEARDVHASR
ncbi:hypothetical protein SCHPADRAFT_905823 [Schizopora paradoxa]|uniref:Uncharacterized protein n=1 Tax=Schizopora paradoxa TaxID=27342 RepID=A0A0H2RI56_9AGAM|nr:hypothetical protein SCHPADRAFT_905823 [Schizopora paradoxa]